MLTIFIFMAILLSIGTSIALLGQDQIVLAGVYQDGEQAFAVADACTEEGYNRLLSDIAFAGATFPVGGGICTVTVTTIGSDTPSVKNRFIRGTGTFHNSIRIVEANVTIKSNGNLNANKVTINAWKEGN